jgi:pilus assembly protein Flp/PilA
MKLLTNLWNDQSGQDLTEYALLLVLISLVAIASMKAIATAISTVFTTAAADLAVTT